MMITLEQAGNLPKSPKESGSEKSIPKDRNGPFV